MHRRFPYFHFFPGGGARSPMSFPSYPSGHPFSQDPRFSPPPRRKNGFLIGFFVLLFLGVCAYVYCRSAKEYATTYRFTIVRHGTSWKIADWERLDLGLSETAEWAIYADYDQDPRLANYYQIGDHIEQSNKLQESGDLEGAKRELRSCDSLTVPLELEDYVSVLLGPAVSYSESRKEKWHNDWHK
jgi:hypothetical protein